jgi:hypothetical protein
MDNLNVMDANKKITELGLLDLALREYEEYLWDKGYKISILSLKPEMAMLILTLFHMKDKMIEDDVMILCDDMHVGEFIRFFDLEVCGDLHKISLEQVWSELYLTGRANLMFDVRPPVYMRYSKESELQTLEDLREFCRVMER